MRLETQHRTVRLLLRGMAFWGVFGLLFFGVRQVGMSQYATYQQKRIELMLEDSAYVDSLVLGNSHAKSVLLNTMGVGGENLASDAQDLFEVDYKTREVATRIPSLKTVYISVSYFSFLFDNGSFYQKGNTSRSWLRVMMYAECPFSIRFISGDFLNYIKGMLFPLITADHFENGFRNIGKDGLSLKKKRARKIEAETLSDVRKTVREATSILSKAQLDRMSLQRCGTIRSIVANMQKHRPSLSQETLEVTRRIVRALQTRKIKVVFFTPPYYQMYNRCIPSTWKKQMLENMTLIQVETGARYFDFSAHPEFTGTEKLFMNSDHLNHLGSRLFSVKLKARMDAWMKAQTHESIRPSRSAP